MDGSMGSSFGSDLFAPALCPVTVIGASCPIPRKRVINYSLIQPLLPFASNTQLNCYFIDGGLTMLIVLKMVGKEEKLGIDIPYSQVRSLHFCVLGSLTS